jgi:hypothetical protein
MVMGDDYNQNLFDYDSHFNKLKYDLFKLPDLVNKFDKSDLESNFFKYNYVVNLFFKFRNK